MTSNGTIVTSSIRELMPLIIEALENGLSIRFSPRGTSMLPMIRQGIDSVILSPLPRELQKYDIPLYQRENGQYVLHRIIETGPTFTCMGDNQFTPEPGLRRDQMIAVVTAFYRRERMYPMTHPIYRLYCIVWHHSHTLRRFAIRASSWLSRHLCRQKNPD